jgi:MurNAc alpha-1-phosphate uridylyltransferase
MTHPCMIFAAGLGTRMGALTRARPKPLIEVAGRPLIAQALGFASEAAASPVVVNLHWKAEMLRAHLAGTGVTISDETSRLLETGGGLKAALPLLARSPAWTLNSDAAWSGPNPLLALAAAWREGMEALLLLVPRERALGHAGHGDFSLNASGRLARGPGLVYTGAQLLRTDAVARVDEDVFSLNAVWDGMAARRTLFGLVHAGAWCDVGRPENLPLAERLLLDGS